MIETLSKAIETTEASREGVCFFDSLAETDLAFQRALIHTDVVLDIGCGIRPFTLFKPKVHLGVEPWPGYIPLLQKRFEAEPGFVPLKIVAPEALSLLPDKAVDTVLLLDVIEHMEKERGEALLKEAERLARVQIVVFTPLGFMEQEYGANEKDAWGLTNTDLQKHLSGWVPEDFGPSWRILACETYHEGRFGDREGFGAFYAIKDVERVALNSLPLRSLVISNLALPSKSHPELERAFLEVFSQIDPSFFGILTYVDYAPYNPSPVFPLHEYSQWRLACPYHHISPIPSPAALLQAQPEDLEWLIESDDEFRSRVEIGENLIAEFGYQACLYIDRFDVNLLIALAVSRRTGIPLKVVNLGGEARMERGLPIVDGILNHGVLDLDLEKLPVLQSARAVIEYLAA